MTWYCGESAGSAHIGVVHLITVTHIHAAVGKIVVVDIRDVRNIGNSRVRDIHAIEITATYAVPRDERFAKT